MERRTFLKGAVIAGATPAAALAPALAPPVKLSLEEKLARMEPRDRADYHASQLAKAMKLAAPNSQFWNYDLDFDVGVALVWLDHSRSAA